MQNVRAMLIWLYSNFTRQQIWTLHKYNNNNINLHRNNQINTTLHHSYCDIQNESTSLTRIKYRMSNTNRGKTLRSDDVNKFD